MDEPAATACPFLVGSGGGWRSDRADRAHRCLAVVPPAPLAADKQRRLCLTAAHPTCATFEAAVRIRAERAGDALTDGSTGRWGYARSVAVVEREVGASSTIREWLAGGRSWQLIPAIVLAAVVVVLAGSGIGRGPGGTAVTSPSASESPSSAPTPTPSPSSAPTPTPSPTSAPTPTPSPTSAPTPTPTPAASYRTYTVKSGDTLYGIARSFGVTLSSLLEVNGISKDKILHAGDVLLIPNP